MNCLLLFVWIFNNLDFVLITLILAFAIYGAARGFFAQLMGTATTLVALVVATLVSKGLMNILVDYTGLDDFFTTRYSAWVENLVPSANGVSASEIETVLGFFPQTIKESIVSYCNQSGSEITFSRAVGFILAKYTILLLCFVFMFVAIKLLFLLLREQGKKLREIKVVRAVDNTLGSLLSVFKLYRILSLILFIINLSPFGILNELQACVTRSHIASFVNSINLFDWILSIIKI